MASVKTASDQPFDSHDVPPPPPVDYEPIPAEPERGQASAPPIEAVIDVAALNQHVIVPEGGTHESFLNAPPTLADMPPRGMKVTVANLVSNYSLNGKIGTVVGYRSDGAVLVDIDGISSAPLHPVNLMWGDTSVHIPQPDFMQPKMNIVEKNGVCNICVKPPSRTRDDTTCCPSAAWSDITFYKQIGWVWTNFFAVIFSWTLTLLLLMFSPFICSQAAIGWRWLAHRQMDILLSAHPPSRGAVVSRPTAVLKHAGPCRYMGSGHTWRCLVYVLIVAWPLSMTTLMLTCMCLPCSILVCCRPLYCFGANIVHACLWVERKVCVGMVGHIVCEYALVGEDAPVMQEGDATAEGSVDEQTPVLTGDGLGAAAGGGSSWLAQRERTREELMSLEKFNNAYLRLFGAMPRLKDITIEPPREPGRGPRHFITIADTVNDTQRLKLVKAYKQAFATMYVHIIDIDEQQRQEGTDYSALYS